jgi:hypothetical protein
MKSVSVLLLGLLLGSITWILSIVAPWFYHDDHAALGWFMLCHALFITAWLTGQAIGWYIRESRA